VTLPVERNPASRRQTKERSTARGTGSMPKASRSPCSSAPCDGAGVCCRPPRICWQEGDERARGVRDAGPVALDEEIDRSGRAFAAKRDRFELRRARRTSKAAPYLGTRDSTGRGPGRGNPGESEKGAAGKAAAGASNRSLTACWMGEPVSLSALRTGRRNAALVF
jgi:hypothetical protein